MRNRLIKLAFLSSVLFSFSTPFVLKTPNTNEVAAYSLVAKGSGYTNHDAGTYYDSISSSLEGESLLGELRNLNKSKRKKWVTYDGMGTSAGASYFIYTDYDTSDPNSIKYDENGQPYGTHISNFYSYTSITGWSREHVWPNTHGGGSGCKNLGSGSPTNGNEKTIDQDIHMTRPASSSDNGDRGCSYYVEGMNHSQNGWDPLEAGFKEESRGEAARIILYSAMADMRLGLEIGNTNSSKSNYPKMGDLETIMKWHCQYPITEREKNRNEGAEYLQGNRNPFIDHPEYAAKIWGNASSKIKEYCENANFDINTSNVPTLNLYVTKDSETSKLNSTFTLNIGDYVTLTPYKDNAVDESAAWSFSGDSISVVDVGINSKQIVAESVGTTNLTLSTNYVDQGETKTIFKNYTFEVVDNSGTTIDSDDDLIQITNITNLNAGDRVVLATSLDGRGVSGFNGKSDATVSTNREEWLQYEVGKNGTNYLFKDTSTNKYIDASTKNAFLMTTTGGNMSTGSDGEVKCNDRYLCENGSNYRFYSTVNSNYNLFYYYKIRKTEPIIIDTKTLVNLEISGSCKTTYNKDEELDISGLTITAYFSDGTTQDVTGDVTISGDTSLPGSVSVVCTYSFNGVTKTVSFVITVVDDTPVIETRVLASLEISGSVKTTYNKDEELDLSGVVVTACYTDGSSENVSSKVTWSGNTSTVGQCSITCVYSSGGVSKSVSFIINVKDPSSPVFPEPDVVPTNEIGCEGSVVTSCGIIFISFIALVIVIIVKKRKLLHH